MNKTKNQNTQYSGGVIVAFLGWAFDLFKVMAGSKYAAVAFLGTMGLLLFQSAGMCQATDIGSAITTLTGYQTAAIVIGIAALLWGVGRYLVHKFTRG